MKVTEEFYGPEFLMRLNQAAGRSIAAVGVNVAIETKRVTHVLSGTLRRSTHAAPASEVHDDDGNTAADQDLLNMSPDTDEGPWGPQIEVGSWLPYACVEWVGRGHPGVQQGMEMVRGARVNAIVAAAFAEAGLGGHGGKGARLGGGGGGGFRGGGNGGELMGILRRNLERADTGR